MRSNSLYSFAVAVLLVAGVLGSSAAGAEESQESKDLEAVARALGKTKLTLLDGIRQATQGTAVPISAKFEMEDGKLSLSVYTAGKGLAVPAEENVLQELSGSPEGDKWTPQVEVFKDVPHVARSAEQLAVLALARTSLEKMVVQAQKRGDGTVFSITPAVKNHRPVAVLLISKKGRVKTLTEPL